MSHTLVQHQQLGWNHGGRDWCYWATKGSIRGKILSEHFWNHMWFNGSQTLPHTATGAEDLGYQTPLDAVFATVGIIKVGLCSKSVKSWFPPSSVLHQYTVTQEQANQVPIWTKQTQSDNRIPFRKPRSALQHPNFQYSIWERGDWGREDKSCARKS